MQLSFALFYPSLLVLDSFIAQKGQYVSKVLLASVSSSKF